MKTIELKGFVHCHPAKDWDGGAHAIGGLKYEFWEHENLKTSGYAMVAPHTITLEVPDNFNPSGQFVAALDEQEKKITAEFQNRVTEIRRQKAQFLAIESA